MESNKQDLRQIYFKQRSILTAEEVEHYSNILVKKLAVIIRDLAQKLNANKKILIALYYPIHNEPQILKIIDLLVPTDYVDTMNFYFALPKVVKDDAALCFGVYKYGDRLITHLKYKMAEPIVDLQKILLPDIIVCPLLAYDKNNYRLGYGGGFYDRTISSLKQQKHKFYTVAVAYPHTKLVENLPINLYDQAIDFIVTC